MCPHPSACGLAWGYAPKPKGDLMAKGLILVVDDEEDILELVRFNLSREGYQ